MPTFKVNPKYALLTEVTKGLYVCGLTDLNNPEKLQHLGITCIINCTNEVPNLPSKFPFERLKLWLDDSETENIFQYFDEISDKIWEIRSQNQGKTLLHCLAGVSRSCCLALAYLIKYEKLSLRRAYAHLALKRPLVRPNLGFWRQLIEYEKLIRKNSTVKIVELSEDENGPSLQIPDVYMDEMRRSCDLECATNQKSESQAYHRRKMDEDLELDDQTQNRHATKKLSLQMLEKCKQKIDNRSDLKFKELEKRREIFGYMNQNCNLNLTVLDKRRKFSNCRKFTPSLESLPELHEREI